MNTDKIHIQQLAEICAIKGIEHAVISPGSRCAPLIVAFNRQKNIRCHSIIDERSAAFVALGIAQQTKKPVALICTSGSAILNYAPALAEAFYQKIPLLVLSADRPNEWIDQGENQSIQQFEVYKNYIKKSYQLPLQVNAEKDLWYSNRIVSEAINFCVFPDFGPVHINIPLREPLYQLTNTKNENPKVIDFNTPHYKLEENEITTLQKTWLKSKGILIVVGGFKSRDLSLEKVLQKISKQSNVVVLTESVSNVYGKNFVNQIDSSIEIITKEKNPTFIPELVITLGAGVVSKKLKFWLRGIKHEHWHLSQSSQHWDIFQSLSKVIQINETDFFSYFSNLEIKPDSIFKKNWLKLHKKTQELLDNFLSKSEFNDFKVFDFLIKNIPTDSLLQLGNSTPVRYVNLLNIDADKNVKTNSNRGVSGIDGVLSTAAGASLTTKNPCICINGDIASLYDSNAFLNFELNSNFKVIIINNGGGNIFKIIPGPDSLDELEQFFETKHNIDFKNIALAYNLTYFSANNAETLATEFKKFIAHNKQASILEINTKNCSNSDSLRHYFDYLKDNISTDKL
ncbi:MAG: 2-succinyl-5-enolpyruvyl-6-hydroxy-3-cyclohexene-1-carboxylic-acid synthase [Chitinophagales bacterium]